MIAFSPRNRLQTPNPLICVALAYLLLFFVPDCFGQIRNDRQSTAAPISLTLKRQVDCDHNLVMLHDIVDLSALSTKSKDLGFIPLGPAPKAGAIQTWSREDVEKALSLRGIGTSSLRWEGAMVCNLQRVASKNSTLDPSHSSVVPASSLDNTTDPRVQRAIGNTLRGGNNLSDGPIDKSRFTSAFTTPATIAQAQRIATTAIEKYLQTRTNSNTAWKISPVITSEMAPLLIQQRKIIGVAGGIAPFDGNQTFEFMIQGPNGEYVIPIECQIELPDLVYSAKKQLAKGHILTESDLELVPVPRGFPGDPGECISDPKELIGSQLRRSMSTQQIIKKQDVGPEHVILAGDAIQLEVVVGSVVVVTNGKAVSSGGINELITVESLFERKRLVGRIKDDRTVQIVSTGNNIAQTTTASAPSGQHGMGKRK